MYVVAVVVVVAVIFKIVVLLVVTLVAFIKQISCFVVVASVVAIMAWNQVKTLDSNS